MGRGEGRGGVHGRGRGAEDRGGKTAETQKPDERRCVGGRQGWQAGQNSVKGGREDEEREDDENEGKDEREDEAVRRDGTDDASRWSTPSKIT
jgi:hypothetical protein